MAIHRHGITLFELLLVVLVVAVFAAMTIPNFLEPSRRSPVSRVKADQRTMATALESYYIDNNRYPPYTGDPPSLLSSLSTPIAYLTIYPVDPFQNYRQTFFYYTDPSAQGWIVFSPGPDRTIDLTLEFLQSRYFPGMSPDALELVPFTYDPSNGNESGGDIFRMMFPNNTPATKPFE